MGFIDSVRMRLGLGDYDEDEYYDDEVAEEEAFEDETDFAPRRRESYRSPYEEDTTAVRRVERGPDLERARSPRPSGGPHVSMHIVEPRSFSEAQAIADRFKAGTPVIINLSSSDADLSKRLLDFASGLTYGLDGGLQRVSEKVFMLTPSNVDVSAEDRRRLRDEGLFTLDV
jgi:cell division inhibitor SepF